MIDKKGMIDIIIEDYNDDDIDKNDNDVDRTDHNINNDTNNTEEISYRNFYFQI